MSKQQTFHSEDNVFLPLRRQQLSSALRNHVKQMAGASQAAKKILKLNTLVSSQRKICSSRIF